MSAKIVTKPDGQSKGYGFVCYEDPESARNAVQTLNGFLADGKRLKVELKKAPSDKNSLSNVDFNDWKSMLVWMERGIQSSSVFR